MGVPSTLSGRAAGATGSGPVAHRGGDCRLRPLVQILDPVEPWEEQSPSVLRFFLTRWPVNNEQVLNLRVHEQVIDVPKISPDRTRQRLGDSLRQPRTAEQLVEVPWFEFVFVRRVEGALWRDRRPRSVYKYWAQLTVWTSLRPCTTSSSSLRQTVDVPLFSSSTEFWILPLCYRDRYAQCQTVLFRTGIDMPVVHVKVVDKPVMAQRSFPFVQVQQTTKVPQLHSTDRVFNVPVAQVQHIIRVQAMRIWSRSHSCSR